MSTRRQRATTVSYHLATILNAGLSAGVVLGCMVRGDWWLALLVGFVGLGNLCARRREGRGIE